MKKFLVKKRVVINVCIVLFIILILLVISLVLKNNRIRNNNKDLQEQIVSSKKQKVENEYEEEKTKELKEDEEKKCFYNYCKIEDEIYFYKDVVDVNVDSFSIFKSHFPREYFAYDEEDNIYYKGNKLNFDRPSFWILNRFFVKDKNGVYFVNTFEKTDLDTDKTVVLNDNYIKDDKYVYYAEYGPGGLNLVKIKNVDAKTFKIFTDVNGNIFAEDKNGVCYGSWSKNNYKCFRIKGLKRETLKYSGFNDESNYLRDDSNCFKYERATDYNIPKKVNMSECVKAESEKEI